MPKLTGATPNEEIQLFPLALMVHIYLKIVQDTLCKKSREEHGLLTQYDLEFRNAFFSLILHKLGGGFQNNIKMA